MSAREWSTGYGDDCPECASLERQLAPREARITELEAENKALREQRQGMQERLRQMFYRIDSVLQHEEN